MPSVAPVSRPRLFLLDGPSSSGKTSIARALQELCNRQVIHLVLDTAIAMMPHAFTGAGVHADRGYRLVAGEDGVGAITRFIPGDLACKLDGQLAKFAAALVADGFDVVFDQVVIDDATMARLLAPLDMTTTYVVAVECDLQTLTAREQHRDDWAIGLARDQHRRVHGSNRLCDVTVNSGRCSAGDAAAEILAYAAVTSPTAAARMAARHT